MVVKFCVCVRASERARGSARDTVGEAVGGEADGEFPELTGNGLWPSKFS